MILMNKKFKLDGVDIKVLIVPMGSCVASDLITVEGMQVGYMYREDTEFDGDSGWRFFSGTESQDYVDNPDNIMLYDVNTIANYDSSIIPFLNAEIGSELEKREDGNFYLVS